MKKRLNDNADKTTKGREDTRTRVLSAALKLLNEEGRDGVTTRAVAELAGVKPPILYRLFTDKQGLLNALAEHGYLLYVAKKRFSATECDPIDALRSGWDQHIQFGLDHASLYLLMYAEPQTGPSPAADLSLAMLHRHITRVAAMGKLRLSEERAVALFHAAAVGIVLCLLQSQVSARDLALSSMARENALSLIAFTDQKVPTQSPVAAAAMTLDAGIKAENGFSSGEFGLFKEWLGRLKSK